MLALASEHTDSVKLSVIVCTYNPNDSIIAQCLDRIAIAAEHYKPLEVIIVDNNSSQPIAISSSIKKFHERVSASRVVVEKKQGLTPARLRGISEAKGDLLVFIDDDNFISSDFFLNVAKISTLFPFVGAFSGQVKLQFEITPPLWSKKYWGLLVYREFKGNYWSNLPNLSATIPCGAGMVVRRDVAKYYYELHESGKRNIQLDRTATSLLSAGDNDLAACATDIGLGVGIFDSLVLDHFIPKERVSMEYLVRLAEGISKSAVVFRSFRGEDPKPMQLKTKVANALRILLKNKIDREFYKAVLRGEKLGKAICENNQHN
jgi:glycosyltransferase involved in cell wall biosynthesis